MAVLYGLLHPNLSRAPGVSYSLGKSLSSIQAKSILGVILIFLICSASAQEKTLIVPDKDADGLDAGVIIHRTLTALGLPASCIDVHLLEKGHNVHDESEREAMSKKEPKYIIVLDQGSRPGPPMIESSSTKSLIIDHHLSDEFPENSMVIMSRFSRSLAYKL